MPRPTPAPRDHRPLPVAATQRSRPLATALAGTAMALGVAVGLSARRKRISVRAMLVNAVAGLVAPALDDPDALDRAIAQARQRGPALPPRRLRHTMRFVDEGEGGARQFRLTRADARPAPTLLYLHGGAYVFEVQSVQWNLVAGLLKLLPANVLAPMYPLAPEHDWQESIAAVERSYRALAAEIGARNIVLLGDSAGGGLALLLAQRLRATGGELPAAIVLVSPWLDIGCGGDDQPALEQRDPALSIAFLRAAGRMWAGNLSLDDPRVSPLFGDVAGLPPTIMFSGGRDVLASDAFRLAARDPAIVHHHYEEMIHVWSAAPIPEAKRALREAAAFIEEHIGHG